MSHKVHIIHYISLLLPVIAVVFAVNILLSTNTAQAWKTYTRWHNNSVEWKSYISGPPFPSNATSLIDSQAQKWSKPATGRNFSFVHYDVAGPTQSTVDDANFPANGWGNNPGLVNLHIGIDGYIISATLYLNNTWSWNTACHMDEVQKIADFRVIVLHELGHVLSLDHDPEHPEAVMWPDYNTCKLHLAQDDLDGIVALYGWDAPSEKDLN